MKEITFIQAQQLTFPNPFALISTCDQEENNNLMALSWWTYLSNHPATIGICLSEKSYSQTLIRENGQFCLCVPDQSLAASAFRCGTCSGRSVKKSTDFHIELEDSVCVKPKRVKKSRVILECQVSQSLTVHDHMFFVAEVAACYGNPEASALYAMNGYKQLESIKPDFFRKE